MNRNYFQSVFLERLANWNDHFMRESHLENLMHEPTFSHLVEDINTFCSDNMLLGFHFTRAFSDNLLARGLEIRSGEEIRRNFLIRFPDLFTAVERAAIQDAWGKYFTQNMRNSRDGRLFFNFTTSSLRNGKADRLLNYYGGEQVYFSLSRLPTVCEKLKSIGQALIVKCALNSRELTTYIPHPWGTIATSSYHRLINPDAFQIDIDGWQSIPVMAERMEVTAYQSLIR